MVASHMSPQRVGTQHADLTGTQGLAQAVTKCSKDRHASVWRALRRPGLSAERYEHWEQQGLRSSRYSSRRSVSVRCWVDRKLNETKCEGSQF